MKYVDEFRSPQTALALVSEIRALASRRWVLMEVCGGQTHGLIRHGIDLELQEAVELIHGPGCPVCVTDSAVIDRAIELATTPGIVLASFGDMLRVPGKPRLTPATLSGDSSSSGSALAGPGSRSGDSLLIARGRGARVMTVYSPVDAVAWAAGHPESEIVFLAVGFETTLPATALAILQAEKLGLKNFSVLASHVRVEPAMEAIVGDPENRVQAFLAAGHVCCITGYSVYQDFAERHRVPVVVTGFEPLDLLNGILHCVRQLEAGTIAAENTYERTVTLEGNRTAVSLIDQVFEISDQTWRGLGVIPRAGYRIRDTCRAFDATHRFPVPTADASHRENSLPDGSGSCRAGAVLAGKLKPCDCPEFATGCTPDHPLGAPMVSDEGACSAWFRYRAAR